ncbi:MAG: hypothetical protein FWG73_02775 [Planctomycetaceae bacterium]|nr:hypothetical protein [Planctomycetaceae bacterium]
MKTMLSNWKISTLVLAFFVVSATFAAAQEMTRTAAEIQAEINKLQLELQGVLAADKHVLTAEQKMQSKQEHLSAMFRDFPKLLNEQRYEEALHMAQKAKLFAPDDPNIRVMEDVAVQIYNIRQKHLRPTEEDVSQIRQQLILQQLEIPVALNIESPLPLEEVLNIFCGQMDIPWFMECVTDIDVSTETLVHIPQGHGIHLRLRTVLDLILDPLGLIYVVNGDELHITTKHQTQGELFVKIYYVGDIKNSDGLIEIIPAIIEPNSWVGNRPHGEGLIQAHAKTLSLAVRQTAGVHTQIEGFLTQVREVNEIRQASR